MTEKQLFKISETLEDFKVLLSRYKEIKNDEIKLREFFMRNRNPTWDISNVKFFKTGLLSDLAKKEKPQNLVDDHFIQRSKSLRFLFMELEKTPDMNVDRFIFLLKKFCSTVKITKEEHIKVTTFSKKNPSYLNYETYVACNIKVDGLSEIILN